MVKKCIKCGRETENQRRGMCITCYRISTGFSGGDTRKLGIEKLEKEITKMKNRISFMEVQLNHIKKNFI